MRIKKQNKDGIVRLESQGEIKEILISEDLLSPKKETVSVCFRGKGSSGIIDFSPDEMEHLYARVRPRMGLVKEAKIMRG